MCSRVLPADEVLPAAVLLARDVADNAAPLSVAASKELLWSTWELSAEQIERRETALHHELMGHSDAREGVLAYLEKRAPRWTGAIPDRLSPRNARQEGP